MPIFRKFANKYNSFLLLSEKIFTGILLILFVGFMMFAFLFMLMLVI